MFTLVLFSLCVCLCLSVVVGGEVLFFKLCFMFLNNFVVINIIFVGICILVREFVIKLNNVIFFVILLFLIRILFLNINL